MTSPIGRSERVARYELAQVGRLRFGLELARALLLSKWAQFAAAQEAQIGGGDGGDRQQASTWHSILFSHATWILFAL